MDIDDELYPKILKSSSKWKCGVMFVVLLDIVVFAYLYIEGPAFGESD